MDKPAVIDASPLVFFSRGQQMDLLRHFANRIFVPEPVADEILMKGPEDVTAKALHNTPNFLTLLTASHYPRQTSLPRLIQ